MLYVGFGSYPAVGDDASYVHTWEKAESEDETGIRARFSALVRLKLQKRDCEISCPMDT